ncbi:hypothetical protein PCE31107_00471 [Pandoraea cepalis]|uniref:Uncharacterized protein n=1 Tax=Pandoraea cepalis TaxID=2508294 RepID=A0A5E4S0C6_9BURK|nr:hypothetical protein PCE31107_00471 [Pandoraea cepalis]
MPFASHRRDTRVAPCYGLPNAPRVTHIPHVPRRHESTPSGATGLCRAFRGARPTRAESGSSTRVPRERSATQHTPGDHVWPAALALLLVANLAAPALARVPASSHHTREGEGAGTPCVGSINANAVPPSGTLAASAHAEVIRRPVKHSTTIKTDYTFRDVLKAVSTARAPFHYLLASVGDAYEVLSGRTMDPDVHRRVEQGADVLDLATSVLPGVRLLRLPGDLADLFDDELGHKPPDPGKLAGLLQYADPRVMGSAPRTLARATARGEIAGTRTAAAAHPARPAQHPAAGVAREPAPANRHRIVDEHTHLRGYAQPLPAARRPGGESPDLVLVNGHHYLKGNAGYYRAHRGVSADHWLIDAPPGSERRAQVPVTYDPSTGTWHAHAPLRLCGGGCGASRPADAPDSIANSVEDIAQAIGHVPDEGAKKAIQTAFSELSALRLRRTNRPDLQPGRDNSIIHHRIALRGAMRKRIDPNAPLIKQQRIASTITATHYGWREASEAFCQENAEILFHRLLENGISRDRIRMITLKPHNKPSHVAVLYTESDSFIELLDRSTPQPPSALHGDGISHELFQEAAYLTRDSTVLLDPWSTTKAISFARATSRRTTGRMIHRALADIGHVPGHPYVVSVTRPLGMHSATPSGRSAEANPHRRKDAPPSPHALA